MLVLLEAWIRSMRNGRLWLWSGSPACINCNFARFVIQAYFFLTASLRVKTLNLNLTKSKLLISLLGYLRSMGYPAP